MHGWRRLKGELTVLLTISYSIGKQSSRADEGRSVLAALFLYVAWSRVRTVLDPKSWWPLGWMRIEMRTTRSKHSHAGITSGFLAECGLKFRVEPHSKRLGGIVSGFWSDAD